MNYDLEFSRNRLPELWALVPDEKKTQINSLNEFKNGLPNWICTN